MLQFRLLSFGLAGLCLAACADRTAQTAKDFSPIGITIFTGGPIYTGVESAPSAEAVAIADGVIIGVGDTAIVLESAGENARIINLDGAAMFPGFTDSHAHLLGIGMRELTLNLDAVGSIAEFKNRIADAVQSAADGAVVYGRGWIETGWPENRMPTRDDLDGVSPNNPVLLTRADGHALVANSAALAAAAIGDETPDPEGGRIERDKNGRATGILIDNAMALAADLIAEPDDERKKEAYAKASDVYAAYGWTGIHNMSVAPGDETLIGVLSDAGAIDIKVYNSLNPAGLEKLVNNGPTVNENGRVITRAVKLYMDGALGSRGALLTSPYADRPDTNGLALMTKEEATSLFAKAAKANIQVNTHAIGDEANSRLLNWYEEIFSTQQNAKKLRWRIEHAQILHTDDIARFAQLGVIASMQPSHAIGDLYFAPDRLGPDRLDGAYAWRALLDAGAIIAGGTDAPVEKGNPLIEFYAAVARRGLDGSQTDEWRPAQAVTRAEALKMFTLWPAIASFQENRLGGIEPGKRADFTVFSKDIMTVPAEEILSAETVMTVVDGEIIYRR